MPRVSPDAGWYLSGRRFGKIARHGHAAEALHHAVLVAADVERAPEALRPDPRMQVLGLVDELEAAALEEADLVGPREQQRDAHPPCFDLAGLDQGAANALRPYLRRHCQAAYLGDVAPEDVEGAVAGEAGTVCGHDLGDEEVAQVLEDVLHRPHQHAPLGRPVADVLEDQRHVLGPRMAHGDDLLSRGLGFYHALKRHYPLPSPLAPSRAQQVPRAPRRGTCWAREGARGEGSG